MSDTALTRCIERLETIERGDWETDRLIFEAVHLPTEFMGSKVESWSRGELGRGYILNTADGYRHLDAVNAPNYSQSLDAALTLVPDNETWEVMRVRTANSPMRSFGHGKMFRAEVGPHQGVSDHAAVALCIAALTLSLKAP